MKNTNIIVTPYIISRWEKMGFLDGLSDDDKKNVAYMMERCAVEFVYLYDCNLWEEYLGYFPECGWDFEKVRDFVEVATFPVIRRLVNYEKCKGYFDNRDLVRELRSRYLELCITHKDDKDFDIDAEASALAAHEFAKRVRK